jgi:hypothetical protein
MKLSESSEKTIAEKAVRPERMPGNERFSGAVTVFFLALLCSPTFFLAGSAGRIVWKTLTRRYEDAPDAVTAHFLHKARLSEKKVPLRSRALLNDERFLLEGRGGWNYMFTSLYGVVQHLLGKRFVSGYTDGRYLLENGTLINHIVKTEDAQSDRLADAVAGLGERLKARGIPFLYFPPLYAICARDPLLPYGATDDTNENLDILLRKLREREVAVIDLRAVLHQQGLDHHALAFKTDHHTRPESGLWTAGVLAEHLRVRHGFSFDADLFAPDRYETVIYPGIFRGTFFSSYGPWYLEPDDFPVITPKFPTSFTVESETKAGRSLVTGGFRETLLDMTRLDDPDSDLFLLYTGNNFGLHRVVNHNPPNEKKILLIHDSYSCSVIPFLASACRELLSVDLRPIFRTVGDLDTLIDRERPDIVILEAGLMGINLDEPNSETSEKYNTQTKKQARNATRRGIAHRAWRSIASESVLSRDYPFPNVNFSPSESTVKVIFLPVSSKSFEGFFNSSRANGF